MPRSSWDEMLPVSIDIAGVREERHMPPANGHVTFGFMVYAICCLVY